MFNNIIKAILMGAIVIGSVCGGELQLKKRTVFHPDFDIASDGTFIVKN